MTPAKDTKVIELEHANAWFDEGGILCLYAKKGPAQTLAQVKESLEKIKDMVGYKKVCVLADVTNATESPRPVREYVALELPKFIKAVAVVSGSELGKMLVNLFLAVKEQPYPVKIFVNESEAKEWLKNNCV